MITFATEDGQSFALDVDPSIEIENLHALLEIDAEIPAANQAFYFNNTHLSDPKRTLASYGVGENELLLVRNTAADAARAAASSAGSTSGAGSMEQDAETLRLQILGNPEMMAQLRAARPELAEAVASDPRRFVELLQAQRTQASQAQMVRMQAEAELAAADEFDIEAQRRIEEAIRQEAVMENLEHAMEYSPESFGRVTMLYVDTQVNGTPVKAFVDSGAQATIMSPECAEKCGIMRLIDRRFAGIARGVGTAKILGRVHSAQMKLGEDLFLPCSFTIMEGRGVDLLFGLDMLKRHQAVIDLSQNALIVQERRIRFLDEHELPDSARMEEEVDENGNPVKAEGAAAAAAGPSGPAAAAANANAVASSGPAKSSFPGSGNTLGNPQAEARQPPTSSGFSWTHPAPSSTSTTAPAPASASTGSGSATPVTRAGAGAGAGTGGPTSKWPTTSIQSLKDLGASESQAIALLDAAGGNVEVAASLLFSAQ